MKISIVILCFNARYTIHRLVSDIRRWSSPDCEIILVDDGSNDGTRTVLKTDIEAIVDRVFYHGLHRGKGAALRTGIAAATGDVTVVHDANFEPHPHEYDRLLEPIATGNADVVFGDRSRRATSSSRTTGKRLLTLFSRICTNNQISDIDPGCMAFRTSAIKDIDLREERFGSQPEIIAKLTRAGRRIHEVTISYHARSCEPAQRATWRDNVRAFYATVKYNVFARMKKPHTAKIGRSRPTEDAMSLPAVVKHS